jgi:hypothetical protein
MSRSVERKIIDIIGNMDREREPMGNDQKIRGKSHAVDDEAT